MNVKTWPDFFNYFEVTAICDTSLWSAAFHPVDREGQSAAYVVKAPEKWDIFKSFRLSLMKFLGSRFK